uniref:Uncharacterized protein n=1 Tax=Coccidioides posadasii RMSCC 3488 TaxID=454284 RepID=A0A0J6FDS2_COCPO|nr:hypothetical protein CPAG_03765 [Coccidioides posadasii RMSCC 3488]
MSHGPKYRYVASLSSGKRVVDGKTALFLIRAIAGSGPAGRLVKNSSRASWVSDAPPRPLVNHLARSPSAFLVFPALSTTKLSSDKSSSKLAWGHAFVFARSNARPTTPYSVQSASSQTSTQNWVSQFRLVPKTPSYVLKFYVRWHDYKIIRILYQGGGSLGPHRTSSSLTASSSRSQAPD